MNFRLPSAPSLLPALALSACVATHGEIRDAYDGTHAATFEVLAKNGSVENPQVGVRPEKEAPASPLCTTSGWVIMDQIFNEDGTVQPAHALRDIDDLMAPENLADLDGPFEILLAPGSQMEFTGTTMPSASFYMVPPDRMEEVMTQSTAYELILRKANTDRQTGNPSNTPDQIGDHFWIDATVAEARCPAYYQEHQPKE